MAVSFLRRQEAKRFHWWSRFTNPGLRTLIVLFLLPLRRGCSWGFCTPSVGLYEQCGLEVEGEYSGMPDHLAMELEFLSFLYQRATDKEIGGFIEDHLNWIILLREKFKEFHSHPFYRSALEVLLLFLERKKKGWRWSAMDRRRFFERFFPFLALGVSSFSEPEAARSISISNLRNLETRKSYGNWRLGKRNRKSLLIWPMRKRLLHFTGCLHGEGRS